MALLFVPQYRRLWVGIRGAVSELRDRPWEQTLGYLLKHWSFKVVVLMLLVNIVVYGAVLFGGGRFTLD